MAGAYASQSESHEHSGWLAPLVFLVLFAVFYVTALPLMDDSDVPWHLATGKLLLETHRVPTTDPWSFASNGQPWYLLSWIWDLILGVVERCFGLFGVLIFMLAASAATVALLTAHLLTRPIALPAILFTVMMAGLCILDFITARPHLSGYIMALVFYILLHRSRESTRYGALLLLPPLMAMWANMHGSFIAGFTVLGAFLIEAYATGRRDWCKHLFLISIACAFCAALNPYGLDVIIGAMRTLNGSMKKYTIEWLPFAFSASAGVSAWLIVFIMATNLRGSRAAIADKILAIGWLVATFFIMRNGPIFILLSAPYLATCLDEATEGLREIRPPSPFQNFMDRQKLRHVWIATLCIFAAMVAVVYKLPHDDKIMSEDMSAYDAIDFAVQHYPDHRFLSDFNFGGQIIYREGNKLPFFMDSRAATVYGEKAMQDYIEFIWQRDGWQERLAPYHINGLLISKATVFAKSYEFGQYRQDWQLVFAGKRANVYIARP